MNPPKTNLPKTPRRGVAVPRGAAIGYKDLEILVKCITPQGQLVSRKRTGFTAQRQRELKKAIKHARHLALLPFVV
jgi:small subunit ribosomal protein S18